MGPEATGGLLLQGSLFLLHKKKTWSNKKSSIFFYSSDHFQFEWHFKNAALCWALGRALELYTNDFALKELTV